MAIDWGSLIQGGLGVLGSLDRASGAKKAAQATRPMPFEVFGPAGGVSLQGNRINLNPAANPFASIFNALGAGSFANAATAPGSFLYGASPEIAEAYGGLFGQGLTDRIQGQYDLLSQLAAPEEARQREGLDTQLFSRGMLGTTGGAERFRGLEEALGQADLQRQLQAVGLGRQEALDRFTGAMQGVQQGMAGQQQNFNIGMGAFGGLQQLMQNLFQQAGLGIGAGGGQAPAAAINAANAGNAPWQAAMSFLENSGLFNQGGGGFNPVFAGGNVPGLPGGFGSPTVTPPINFPMPSGNFGL